MKRLTILILYLLLLASCSPLRIPEVTSNLRTIPAAFNTADSPIISAIIHKDSTAIIHQSGRIERIKTATGIVNRSFDFKEPLHSVIDNSEQYLIVKTEKQQLLGFDMNEMKSFRIEGQKDSISINVTSGFLVNWKEDKVEIKQAPKGDQFKEIKLMENELFRGIDSLNKRLIILTSHRLLFLGTMDKSISYLDLKKKALSDFEYHDNHIYYGTASNELVKLDIYKNSVKWIYKLPSPLKSKPLFHSNMIVIIPEDNNLYTINTRGSLISWHKLAGDPFFDPVPMEENICIVTDAPPSLPTCIFFNPAKKSIIKETLGSRIISQPQYSENELYMVLEKDLTETDEGELEDQQREEEEITPEMLKKTFSPSDTENKKLTTFEKIGNLFDIALTSDPDKLKFTGNSISYRINPINFIKPNIAILIFDKSEKEVFKSFFPYGSSLNFTWIPESEGEYTLKALVSSKNRNQVELQRQLKVFNPKNIIEDYYLYIQKNSQENGINNNDPAKNIRFPEKEKDKMGR